MHTGAEKSKRRVFEDVFVLEGDKQYLHACRLQALGMYGYNMFDRFIYDQVVGYFRRGFEASVYPDLDEDGITKGGDDQVGYGPHYGRCYGSETSLHDAIMLAWCPAVAS